MVEVKKSVEKVGAVHPLDIVSTEQVGDVVSKTEITKAFDEEQSLLKAKRKSVDITFEIAARLKRIRDNRWYKILGHNDFQEWVESPEIDIDRATAYRYIKLYEAYIVSGAFTIEELEDRSTSKMEILLPYVDVQSDDWRNRKVKLLGLMELSRADLVEHLNRELSDNRYALPKNNGEITNATFEDVPASSAKPRRAEHDAADDVVANAVEVAGDRTIPHSEVKKRLNLSGWYELVPVDKPVGEGKEIHGAVIQTQVVMFQGSKVFANIE